MKDILGDGIRPLRPPCVLSWIRGNWMRSRRDGEGGRQGSGIEMEPLSSPSRRDGSSTWISGSGNIGGTGTLIGVERGFSRRGSANSSPDPYDMSRSCERKLGRPPEKLRPWDITGAFGGKGGIISLALRRDMCASGSSA